MRLDHELDAVGDDLPGCQRVPHALVAHGDAVAYARHAERQRHAPRLDYALLDLLHQLVEMDVPGDDLVPRVGDADERPLHLLVVDPNGPKQASARRLVQALLDGIAAHIDPSWTCPAP